MGYYNKLQELSPAEYIQEINSLYEMEVRVIEECFGGSSNNFINKIFSAQFLENYKDKLIHSPKGIKYILQNKEVEVVAVISNLYKTLTNSVDGFKEPFENFVYEEITSLLVEVRGELLIKKSSTIYMDFIQKLMKKNNELEEILMNSFPNYTDFVACYKNGIEKALVKNPLQIPVEEMLAVYVDNKLKTIYSNK